MIRFFKVLLLILVSAIVFSGCKNSGEDSNIVSIESITQTFCDSSQPAETSIPVITPQFVGKYEYTINDNGVTINEYIGKETQVIIPESVTKIGENAFSNCRNLKSITIPDSVTEIGNYAFKNCNNLNSIYIGKEVKSLGLELLLNCPNLTEIKIGKENKNFYLLDDVIFKKDNDRLVFYPPYLKNESYTIPETVKYISSGAFSGCKNLKTINIPNSIQTITNDAFMDCTSLENVNIADGVVSIGFETFSNCTSLKCITLPDSITNINDCAFSECSNLSNIKLPDNLKNLKDNLFYNCTSLSSITISKNVEDISESAFSSCTNLQNVEVDFDNKNYSSQDGVLYNKDKNTLIAYPSDKKDSNFSVPDSVAGLSEFAFLNITYLKEIFLSKNIDYLPEFALRNCPNLKKINVDKANKYYTSEDGVLYNKDKNTLIAYPNGKKESSFSVPDSVEKILQYAFYGCTSIKKIKLPESIECIAYKAFYGCTNLESINIPKNIKYIENAAFLNCPNLKNFNIPDGIFYSDSEDYNPAT